MNDYIKITIYIVCALCLLLPLLIVGKVHNEIVLRNLYLSLLILGIIFIFLYNYYPTKNPDEEVVYNKFYLEIGLSCIIPGILGSSIIFYYITKKKKSDINDHFTNIYNNIIKSKMKL
jgi:hypothetical protein